MRGVPKVDVLNQLISEEHDEIDLGYTDGLLTTVVYKLDGATVATLTLSYTGTDLTNIIKS